MEKQTKKPERGRAFLSKEQKYCCKMQKSDIQLLYDVAELKKVSGLSNEKCCARGLFRILHEVGIY